MSEPARVEEPRPRAEVRVGSTPNALVPISSAERSLAAGPWQWASLVLVAGAAVIADQLTKWVVSSALAFDEAVGVAGPFSIQHVRNSGIAFGLFASRTSAVILVTAVAVGAMVAFFARSAQRHPLLPVALGFVLGGSVSNLVDRIRLGYVTDFLHLRYWPAFNLADSFIVVGVGILLFTMVLADREPRRRQRVTDAPPARP